MKDTHTILLVLIIFVFIACTSNQKENIEFTYKGNPLVRHIYTADPAARVFNDRLFLYTSHDEDTADADEDGRFRKKANYIFL